MNLIEMFSDLTAGNKGAETALGLLTAFPESYESACQKLSGLSIRGAELAELFEKTCAANVPCFIDHIAKLEGPWVR